jgi:hypothetical protein
LKVLLKQDVQATTTMVAAIRGGLEYSFINSRQKYWFPDPRSTKY